MYREAYSQEHLSTSIIAVGLAGLANSVKSPQLLNQAMSRFGSALQLTNSALCSPDEATTDSTVLAVMLLAMYEMVTFQKEESF